ncbi:hypothetical protein SO802_027485 [Lithocarpus litseifolius]|uniref:Uncharacterized protein n=1 Tax=Lithocarpus litseifolius TaxID=425828 RepID=A0AAW2C602_9ROSI
MIGDGMLNTATIGNGMLNTATDLWENGDNLVLSETDLRENDDGLIGDGFVENGNDLVLSETDLRENGDGLKRWDRVALLQRFQKRRDRASPIGNSGTLSQRFWDTYTSVFEKRQHRYWLDQRFQKALVFVFVHTDSHQAEACDSKAAAEQG